MNIKIGPSHSSWVKIMLRFRDTLFSDPEIWGKTGRDDKVLNHWWFKHIWIHLNPSLFSYYIPSHHHGWLVGFIPLWWTLLWPAWPCFNWDPTPAGRGLEDQLWPAAGLNISIFHVLFHGKMIFNMGNTMKYLHFKSPESHILWTSYIISNCQYWIDLSWLALNFHVFVYGNGSRFLTPILDWDDQWQKDDRCCQPIGAPCLSQTHMDILLVWPARIGIWLGMMVQGGDINRNHSEHLSVGDYSPSDPSPFQWTQASRMCLVAAADFKFGHKVQAFDKVVSVSRKNRLHLWRKCFRKVVLFDENDENA